MGYTQEELNLIFNELMKLGIKIIKNNQNNCLTDYEHSTLNEIIKLGYEISKNIKDEYTPHLYLLYSDELNLYKIGITNDIKKRMREIKLQTNIKKLELIYLLEGKGYLENEFHKEFKHLNKIIFGRKNKKHIEWFNIDNSILEKFKEYA